jgi:hypothetical protein
MNQHDFR